MAGYFPVLFMNFWPAAQLKRNISSHAALPVIASFAIGYQIYGAAQNNVWPCIDMFWQLNMLGFCPHDCILNSSL